MENYKEDIINTRVGGLGSSDGKLLLQIAKLGFVPKSAYNRLAICKGLIPPQDTPTTSAMRLGDNVEMAIYESLKQGRECESNPLWRSNKYARKNFSLLSHPDIVFKDEEKKILYVVECKATHFDFEHTRHTYKAQLFIHYIIAQEKAKELGKDWKVKILLAVYDTNGCDEQTPFDPNRLTVKETRISKNYFDIEKTLDIIDEFLESFVEYYDGEEVDGNLLPVQVREQFNIISNVIGEIKEREAKLEEFKKKLYDFMHEKGIRSIKNESFSFTKVEPTVQKSFDHKKFIEDEILLHPRKTKRLIAKYTKTTSKKGFVQIKVK